MLKLFKSTAVLAIPAVFLLTTLIWLRAFLEGPGIYPGVSCSMPFYGVFSSFAVSLPLLSNILAILIILLAGGMLNLLINVHELTPKRTYLPLFCNTILMSGNMQTLGLYPQLFANLFIILACYLILNTYRKNKDYQQTFLAGACVGLASLFYLPALFLLPALFIALLLLRPFIWREHVIVVLGSLFPALYVCCYYFWFDKMDSLYQQVLCYFPSGKSLDLSIFKSGSFSLWFMIGMLFIGLWKFIQASATQKIKTRKSYYALLWLIPVSISTLLLIKNVTFHSITLLHMPVAVLMVLLLYHIKKRWIAESLFWIFVGIQLVSIWWDKLESLYL